MRNNIPFRPAARCCCSAACTVGPDFVPPAAHVPDNYAAPGDATLTGTQHLAPGHAAGRANGGSSFMRLRWTRW